MPGQFINFLGLGNHREQPCIMEYYCKDLGPYAKTLLIAIFPQGIPYGVFQGDFDMLKQTLTCLREKSQGDFQGS